ncbi:hypothetical protein P9112_011109 [Eukaryota sp. TZLM1-RC]
MPTVSVPRDVLFSQLEKTFTKQQFEDLCFDFGIELDEETTESQLNTSAKSTVSGDSDAVIYRIEVPANRIDLLCVEGIATALRCFMYNTEPTPCFSALSPATFEIIVDQSTSTVRPFIVAAILPNVTLTNETYKSFIDLQDKLHQNYCRRRTLVAIGTHDLDTIQGPLTYTTDSVDDINFAPLNGSEVKCARNVLNEFSQPGHYLRPYVSIINDWKRHPVIYDSQNTVLSLPPVINGNHSKITLNTRNILIECTATDKTKAQDVLSCIVSMFSSLCDQKNGYIPVKVTYNEFSQITPQMDLRRMNVEVSDISKMIGVEISADSAIALLKKMMLTAEKVSNSTVSVSIPPTRNDILHPCDIVEDAAVAYGFGKVPVSLPDIVTIGSELPSMELVEYLRQSISSFGFVEICTFTLMSVQDSSSFLGIEDNGVVVSNPKGSDFERVRSSLIPGLLKTAGHNKGLARPLKLYEIGDVVTLSESDQNGAINQKRLAALYSSNTAGFEFIHGLLDRIAQWLDLGPYQFTLKAQELPYLIRGHQASIVLVNSETKDEVVVGELGSVAVDVVRNFDLAFPCSILELNLEVIMDLGL